MIKWINTWAQGIIVAVIIATVIEMIVPDGNNKKYIKTVIGVYILFTIVYPIITNVTGKKIDINQILRQDNYSNESYVSMGEKLIQNTDKQVESNYIENTKKDIKKRIEEKGYSVIKVEIEIETKDENKYGQLDKIVITVGVGVPDNSNATNNTISPIDPVNITIGNNTNSNKTIETSNKLDENQINEIKELLNNIYSIERDKIHINP